MLQDGVLIVGAGLAGLSCARALAERGADVRVLEKSRGVGGRCATRRVEGQPVDHGLAFYHGDDPGFLSALRSVESAPLVWPRRIAGDGAPCQPRALRADEQRLAFAPGVSAFPKWLARGLTVDLQTRALGLDREGDHLAVATESGRRHRARSVVLTPPARQTAELLSTLEPTGSTSDLAAVVELLAGVSTVRCLTVLAGYEAGAPLPDWDVCYPRESGILQGVSRDSAKRPAPARPVLVLQARPRWSALHWNDPAADWRGAVLDAAGRLLGDWATRPAWVDDHRWRHARLAGGDGLTGPLLLRLGNGSRIGIAGEALAEGGGAQGAWLSGRRMAGRLLGEEQA